MKTSLVCWIFGFYTSRLQTFTMEQIDPQAQDVDLPLSLLPWVNVYRKEPSAFIYDEHSRECTMFHFGIYRHSSTCAGKAATRYSLGSRLTVAGRHFLHLFALLSADLVIAVIDTCSERSLSSSLCCQFRVLALPTLRPKTRSCSRESEVFCTLWCSSQVAWLIPSRLLVLRGWSSKTVSLSERLRDWDRGSDSEQAECQSLQTLIVFSTERKEQLRWGLLDVGVGWWSNALSDCLVVCTPSWRPTSR